MSFHRKYCRKNGLKDTYAPADLEGEDLLDIFLSWVKELGNISDDRQIWISVMSAEQWASRVVVVELRVGVYGEPGDVVNVETGGQEGRIEYNQAPTGQNRVLLFVPERGDHAYFLSENSNRGAAGSRVLKEFKTYFSEYTSKITMETATVTQSEKWSELAKLTEVEVRIKGKSADIADGTNVQVGRISYIALPEKNVKFFPGKLLKSLGDEQMLKRIVCVPELPEERQVYVTMKDGDRKKKFELGTGGAPTIREVLNDPSEPPLDTRALVARCEELVSDLCGRQGSTWESEWSRPL
jgi:hypothetical protein